MTLRTYSYLNSALADTLQKSISGTDLQDAVDTMTGAYGELRLIGATFQQAAIGTTFVLANIFNTPLGSAGESNGVVVDKTTSKLTVPVDGTYRLVFNLTMTVDPALLVGTDQLFTFRVYKNGASAGIGDATLDFRPNHTHAPHATGGDDAALMVRNIKSYMSTSMTRFVSLVANDELQIYVQSLDSGGLTAEFGQADFSCELRR